MELATAVFPSRPAPTSMNLVYGHFCGSLFWMALSIARASSDAAVLLPPSVSPLVTSVAGIVGGSSILGCYSASEVRVHRIVFHAFHMAKGNVWCDKCE